MASVTIRGGGGGGGCGTGGLGGGGFFIVCICKQRGIPLIRSPMGQKNLAVSTGGHIKEGFFLQENAWQFLQGGQKKWP